MTTTDTTASSPGARKRTATFFLGAIVLLGLTWFLLTKIGVYSIQPIGAIPDGATAVVWREDGEPFFNSADALCLERLDGVSLLCRAMAMGQAPTDRIIVRMPYWRWAYLQSTGGLEFDR